MVLVRLHMPHQNYAQLIVIWKLASALSLLRFCHPPTTLPSVESSIASHVSHARNNGLSAVEAGVLLLYSLSRAIIQIVKCAPMTLADSSLQRVQPSGLTSSLKRCPPMVEEPRVGEASIGEGSTTATGSSKDHRPVPAAGQRDDGHRPSYQGGHRS